LSAAERGDELFDVADLGDAEAEILADFHGLADADWFVVDQEFEGFFTAFENSMMAPVPRRMTSESRSFRSASLTITGTLRRRMRGRSALEISAGGAVFCAWSNATSGLSAFGGESQ